ncbi:hypothetical protein RUND412_004435 [Rhizina undulata]
MPEILEPRELTGSTVNIPTMASEVRSNSGMKITVLHGLGSAGKSQIALEFAHRYSHCYTSIFWIDVHDLSRTTHSESLIMEQLVSHYGTKWRSSPNYQEIANILRIPEHLDSSGGIKQSLSSAVAILKAIHHWLSAKENCRWLLLVDSSDHAKVEELDKLIPK